MRLASLMIAACVALPLTVGCKSRPAEDVCAIEPACPPPVQMLNKPAIDLSRGGGGFPLATKTVPMSKSDLTAALTAGYAERLENADAIKLDIAEGPAVGWLNRLVIDISGSAVRPDFVPKSQPKVAEPVAYLRVHDMQYIADPLKYQHFTASMRLETLNAVLGILPAGDGTYGLSLVNCQAAHARLELSMDGLRQSLAAGIKTKQSAAFQIDAVDLALNSDDPRSLLADVTVHARLLLIPADFRIKGRIDVDDAFNVHFSQLDATGTNPAGKIVAGVVQGKLDKLNNKAAPLLKLPGDKIKLSDLAMTVGESLVIDAELVGTP
ncbi:MAG: hypothetical protein QM754_11685 [Tepidisphaeraceae bacterium]